MSRRDTERKKNEYGFACRVEYGRKTRNQKAEFRGPKKVRRPKTELATPPL
jgi:hypothetical protein